MSSDICSPYLSCWTLVGFLFIYLFIVCFVFRGFWVLFWFFLLRFFFCIFVIFLFVLLFVLLFFSFFRYWWNIIFRWINYIKSFDILVYYSFWCIRINIKGFIFYCGFVNVRWIPIFVDFVVKLNVHWMSTEVQFRLHVLTFRLDKIIGHIYVLETVIHQNWYPRI